MAEMMGQAAGRKIKAGYFDQSAFSRKEKKILVLKTGIAGLDYCVDTKSEEGKALLESLVPGTELMLFREADNEHDEWAVAVYTREDQQLGHITRYKNETIARLMDRGKRFSAYVDEKPDLSDEAEKKRQKAPTENFELPFSVYMDD